MRHSKRFLFVLITASFFFLGLSSQATSENLCYARWFRALETGIRSADPDDVARARTWFTEFLQHPDDVAARGRLQSLISKDMRALTASLDFLKRDLNRLPFPGATADDRINEMYRIIGELTGPDFEPIAGLNGKLGRLFADPGNQLGVVLDLRVADDIGLAAQRGLPDAGFEITRTNSGSLLPDDVVSRQMDVVDPGSGIFHENKNWPNGWPTEQGAIDRFLEEFRRDIIVHGANGRNFDAYRLNFRDATRAHLDQLKELLDAQFADPFVASRISQEEIDNLKRVFDNLWRSGDAGNLLRFY